ncbi:hypothetical protein ACFQ6V_23700 [Streptomyces roseifaciens]
MSQLVCDNDLFEVFFHDGKLLQELCDWWRANGLSPGEHYVNEPVTIETDQEGRRVLHYTAPIGEPSEEFSMEKRCAPLLVEPPAHWPHT